MPVATAAIMAPIVIYGEQCRDWSQSSELEWLETNGTGAFAMGTVAGANTRRYHALLTATLRPPTERYVLLSKVEEEILCDGEFANLGACQYPGVITPAGFHMLEEFRLDPFPTWTYRTGCTGVVKQLFLLRDRQTVVLKYSVSNKCHLRLRPFLAYRDYHSTQHANAGFNRQFVETGSTVSFRPYADLAVLHLHHNAAGFVSAGNWYNNAEYRKEMERGLDFREDLYSPGWLDFEVEAGGAAWMVATIEDIAAPGTEQVEAWERERRTVPSGSTLRANSNVRNLGEEASTRVSTRQAGVPAPPSIRRSGEQFEVSGNSGDTGSGWEARLEAAADQFLVHRADGSPTIIAGYPWFTDWGRDTMISLPGLLISRGRLEEARLIIEGFLAHLDRGLIPNRFPDSGQAPEYNNADGTLWLFQAAWAYQLAGGDEQFLREMFYPKAKEIIRWHQTGTHYNIQVDPADGLLSAGSPGSQLTWMDAKVGDWVVTPRHGKPVEINALWYNALRMTAWWALRFGETALSEELTTEANRTQTSFESSFWNGGRGCLHDRLAPEGPDDRLRPNQVFAVSLPFPLMTLDQQQSILNVVEAHLLTPYGLRTLEPGHAEYRGRYEGSPLARDGAYHQGTVWPWLMGPYLSGRLQAFGYSPENIEHCRQLLSVFEAELHRGCLGTLAELYDGDPPHRPVGAMAQAWSVAETLRMLMVLRGQPVRRG